VLASLIVVSSATPQFQIARQEERSRNATFVHNTGSGSVAFTVAAIKDAGDLHFHLEAPAEYSWVAVGTGEKMDRSLMWIAYRNGNGTGTIATRASR
jgi:hypothetical protein